ncbi:peptidase family M48-domain-containing protein [Elsinoe ampelina]|uniref:CAAX prenyl protease n=1 Tax=Elsinoe ampelina TaxID=302913 RepID=A0A6A6G971_9PEZI|nr:peptidase family M48-domain-containing protein [Elsinoe ampelina]
MDFLRRLAGFLDRPGFPWKSLIITFSIGEYLLENYLAYRQYRVLQGKKVPKQLENEVDQKTFDKSQDYGRAKAKYGFISGLINQIKSLAIIHYDVYPKFWAITGVIATPFLPARFQGEIAHSLVFVFASSFLETIIGLPLSYYYHFVLEEKYGFNKQTIKLWVTDMLKGQALAIAFGVPLGWGFLKIIQKTGDQFFYYLWMFALAVQLFAITIYPIAIVPLFNKLEPLKPGPLKEAVEALADRLKFPLSELQVIDGSKRSAHSNAYFTGLPWKKKIVIYDTLLEKSSDKEVEAILAHELGHWKRGHTTRLLAISQFHLFFMFTLFSVFIRNQSLYHAFGFHKEQPIMIGFLLFNEVLSPTDALVKLGMNIMTRSMEFEADEFSFKLGYANELASSLIKLQIQNLSSMDADWMYSSFHYSHPILTERLKAIGWVSKEKVGDKKVTSNGQAGAKSEL